MAHLRDGRAASIWYDESATGNRGSDNAAIGPNYSGPSRAGAGASSA